MSSVITLDEYAHFMKEQEPWEKWNQMILACQHHACDGQKLFELIDSVGPGESLIGFTCRNCDALWTVPFIDLFHAGGQLEEKFSYGGFLRLREDRGKIAQILTDFVSVEEEQELLGRVSFELRK